MHATIDAGSLCNDCVFIILVARSNIMRLKGGRVDGIIVKHDTTNVTVTEVYPGVCVCMCVCVCV